MGLFYTKSLVFDIESINYNLTTFNSTQNFDLALDRAPMMSFVSFLTSSSRTTSEKIEH